MKYTIKETGNFIKLHTMTPFETLQTQKWGKHTDRLYADYDFPTLNHQELANWYAYKTRKGRMLVSICALDNTLLGYISLRNIRRFFRTSELGIVLDPNHIENGYGSDAIRTFIQWYFKKLKFRKLYLGVAKYNTRALHVYKKLGFKQKYSFLDVFENTEVDPFVSPKYENIRKYFVKVKNTIYVQCIKMQISTLSTKSV